MSLYDQKKSGQFYDEWEVLSSAERKTQTSQKLNSYLSYCREYSEFYRRRLDTDFLKTPALTSQDLRDNLPPRARDLMVGKRTDFTVFQSGGTTGYPKTSLFSHDELEGLTLPNTRGFFALGLKPEDLVADFFASGSLYMTFVHIHRMLQDYGCTNFPFANHTDPNFIYQTCQLFDVGTWTGVGSYMLELLRKFEREKLPPLNVKKFFFGGEHMFESDRRELQEHFGVETVAAPGYGTIDTWYIGYQCAHSPLGVFHVHDDQMHLEIIDEDNKRECIAEETGMFYVTAYERKLTPIVRYRVGDLGYWLKNPCPCGRTTPQFKLLGRGDDILRIGYDSVDYNSIQEILGRLKLPGTLQMQKARVSGKDQLILRIETETEISRQQTEALENAIYQFRPGLNDLLRKNQILPISIESVAPNSLTRNVRTGKLIRVVDYAE